MTTHGVTQSFWMASATMPTFAPLAGPVEIDVFVIGGGVAGLTTAYLQSREGRRVVLLESMDALGCGETGRSTAHFMPPDERYF